MTSVAEHALHELMTVAGWPPERAAAAVFDGGDDPVVRTPYRVAAAGGAAIAACGIAAAELWKQRGGRDQRVGVDLRAAAAALRSNQYLRIDGQLPPSPKGALTGVYPVRDGRWIYLHCDFAGLRERNLAALGATGSDPADAARAAARWDGAALEEAVFAHGGCGALVRTDAQWRETGQAAAVARQPLIDIVRIGDAPPEPLHGGGTRPLSGVRVLDLTRVLAGPTGARTLAEHGADVLKIACRDLPDSGSLDLDTGHGKRSAWLDLRDDAQMRTLHTLISRADVFSQSYRPGALAARGLGPDVLARLRPGIVCVTLNAWGYDGPWQMRRGYDTVVQAASGMAWRGPGTRPAFMPVSAQDYVAGYLMAFGAMLALHRRAEHGGSWLVRVSLARTGLWIRQRGLVDDALWTPLPDGPTLEELAPFVTESVSPAGRLTHLAPVVRMSETPAAWTRPASPNGTHPPAWW